MKEKEKNRLADERSDLIAINIHGCRVWSGKGESLNND